jgi:membrane protein insertase Oxa1/YidC/SpoIIIJ
MLDMLYTIIIFPITQILEFVFTFSQKVFKNPGISLLCISTAITILCLPLYAVSEKWQEYERNLQKKFKKKIDNIKAVFSGDEQYMFLATFYRQNHYHPIYAMRSSFGLLIQIPFFIAAYTYLSHLDVLQGASFLFLNNLGSPDGLLYLGNFRVNLLPIMMTTVNCIAGAIYTKGFPLKEKLQLYGMAALFLVLLYASPSGLVMYWIMNNIFSLLKNIYYKITFKHKNLLMILGFSILCFYLSFYLLRIYRGDANLRKILALILVFAGIGPWVFRILKNHVCKTRFPSYSNKYTFLIFFVCAASLWIITGLFLPSMLIGSSPQEFSFIDDYTTPLYFICNTSLQSFGLFLFWPPCLYFLFSKNVKNYFASIGLIILLSAIINIFLFPGNYGIISVELVFDNEVSHNPHEIIANLLLLLIPIIITSVFRFFNLFKIFITIAVLCMFSFLGISLYNLIQINEEFQKIQSFRIHDDELEEIYPVFNLSKIGKNVVVIMLDRAQSAFVPFILEESPDLKEIYSGFIYYPNTVSFHTHTRIGVPPLLGGYEYMPSEFNKRDTVPVVTKHNEALLLMPRIFMEAEFEVTTTDPPYPNYSSKEDLRIYDEYPGINAKVTDAKYTNLWIKEHNFGFPSTGAIIKRNLFWYSLFKTLPLAFRRGIYLQGDWCAPGLMQKAALTLNGYSVLDYLPRLTGFKPQKENTALIMVNNTTHEYSFFEAPEYRPVPIVSNYGHSPYRRETAYHTNMASLKRLGDWFDFLKENDVYDNTRIILVSDHGADEQYVNDNTGLPFNVYNYNPILMVKDFNASEVLKTDNTFMTNADVPFLAFENIVDNPVNPFTRTKISNGAKKNPLYIAISGNLYLEGPDTTQFTLDPQKDYYVHDNIFNPANWEKVEK